MADADVDAGRLPASGMVVLDVLDVASGLDHCPCCEAGSRTPGLGTLSVASEHHVAISASGPKGVVSGKPGVI